MKDAIYKAITDIDDRYIQKAATTKLKSRKGKWPQYLAFAAVLTLMIGGGWWSATWQPDTEAPAEGDNAGGHQAGSIFNSYAGPVFPLTMETAQDGITATREIGFDFAPYTTGGNEVLVNDNYVLTNTTDQDQTMQLSYPVCGGLRSDIEILPTITVDGREVATTLKYGGFTGKFADTYGEIATNPGTSYNFHPIFSWTEFETLLGDGTYRNLAQNPQTWTNQPVTVYRFTDHQGVDNASYIYVSYESGNDTTVLTQWFNGGGWDEETGKIIKFYSVWEASRRGEDIPRYLIVLGEDIQNVTVTGYTYTEDELVKNPSVSAKMERYETDFFSIIEEINLHFSQNPITFEEVEPIYQSINPADFTQLVLDTFYHYGPLSKTPYARYDDNRFNAIMQETTTMDRILYTTFPLTVSAGQSVSVSASMIKEASFDYYGMGTGNEDVHGFDMTTTLDSNLAFTTQTATIDTQNAVEITHQNFGFDPEHGITEVTLDIAQPHYYLEVVDISPNCAILK